MSKKYNRTQHDKKEDGNFKKKNIKHDPKQKVQEAVLD